jgi:hypothetical protein
MQGNDHAKWKRTFLKIECIHAACMDTFYGAG